MREAYDMLYKGMPSMFGEGDILYLIPSVPLPPK